MCSLYKSKRVPPSIPSQIPPPDFHDASIPCVPSSLLQGAQQELRTTSNLRSNIECVRGPLRHTPLAIFDSHRFAASILDVAQESDTYPSPSCTLYTIDSQSTWHLREWHRTCECIPLKFAVDPRGKTNCSPFLLPVSFFLQLFHYHNTPTTVPREASLHLPTSS